MTTQPLNAHEILLSASREISEVGRSSCQNRSSDHNPSGELYTETKDPSESHVP